MTSIVSRALVLAIAAALLVPAAAPATTVSTRTAAATAFKKQQAARATAAKRAAAKRAAAKRALALKRRGMISRKAVVSRGAKWVSKRVSYSQSRYYNGYRTDCSGFVSMAWGARTSYTTGTISGAARRISASQLKPGDAVLYSGHVVLFVKWKNKRAGTFVAYEQANSAKDCIKSVKRLKGGKALRYRKIY